MAEDSNQHVQAGRPIDLAGDSPELIAFALLRYLAQIEQDSGQVFDRAWMLDAYAECLETVRGNRASTRQPVQTETFPGMARTRKAARHG